VGATLVALTSAGQAAPPSGATLLAKARAAIARGDGIDAEARLREAQAKGASRNDVAALMGAAYLAQGDRRKAREWLASGQFDPDQTAYGLTTLGRLERFDGYPEAARKALDQALAMAPEDPVIWVEIARLHYVEGDHVRALQAVDRAAALGPAHPRALELKGQVVRDQWGLAASLPWFEAGLTRAPDDVSLLGEYAATLGDLGRASEMLAITRRMLEIDPRNPRAYFLQAVLAARAGNTTLARALMNRTRRQLDTVPTVMLVNAVLELRAGNPDVAVAILEKLAQRQPANQQVQMLLACGLAMAGEHKYLVDRFSAAARHPGAPVYLLTLVGRAHEALGQRDRAAFYLDRAVFVTPAFSVSVAEGSRVGALLASGRLAEAQALAESQRAQQPGSAVFQTTAGDVQLALGRGAAAYERYQLAARIRFSEDLALRMIEALLQAGEERQARNLAETYLARNPGSRRIMHLAAGMAAQSGQWTRARKLLEYLADRGGGGDARLLADLSLTMLRSGDAPAASQVARQAWQVQRANPTVAQAWGMALARQGTSPGTAKALLAKARTIMGDNPLLAEGRRALTGQPKG